MADERLLAPIRRFWSDDQVAVNYEAIFRAYHARLEKVTIITQKGNDGENATAQVVIQSADYEKWLEALEARSQEIDDAAGGEKPLLPGVEHVDFSRRNVRT